MNEIFNKYFNKIESDISETTSLGMIGTEGDILAAGGSEASNANHGNEFHALFIATSVGTGTATAVPP